MAQMFPAMPEYHPKLLIVDKPSSATSGIKQAFLLVVSRCIDGSFGHNRTRTDGGLGERRVTLINAAWANDRVIPVFRQSIPEDRAKCAVQNQYNSLKMPDSSL